MDNLLANYKRILEVLQSISENTLLSYQRRKPKLSDIELISICLTAEYLGIDSENYLFRLLPKELKQKIER
ncbi:IS982 family transposase, partial [Myroides sp. BIT-d1]|nr:IS982 family transposase [Myroides albus]